MGYDPNIDGLENQTAQGSGSVYFYTPPSFSDFSPDIGSVDGGTEIVIEGEHLDVDLGGIKCKFGTEEVDAEVI